MGYGVLNAIPPQEIDDYAVCYKYNVNNEHNRFISASLLPLRSSHGVCQRQSDSCIVLLRNRSRPRWMRLKKRRKSSGLGQKNISRLYQEGTDKQNVIATGIGITMDS